MSASKVHVVFLRRTQAVPMLLGACLALLLLSACTGGGGRSGAGEPRPATLEAPVIASFAPATGTAYAQVTLLGARLSGATQVSFGGAPAIFVVQGADRIVAAVPERAATGPIQVTTPGGVGLSPRSFNFDPAVPELPVVRGVEPPSGPPGTTVRLTGSGFLSVVAVTFAGEPALLPTPVDDHEMLVVVPATAVSGALVLTHPNGAQSLATPFLVAGTATPAPVLTGFEPRAGKPGDRVTLAGEYLASVTEVRLGDLGPLPFERVSGTLLAVRVPVAAPGSALFAVTTPTGTCTAAAPFAILDASPSISRFWPARVRPGGILRIYGSNLANARSVRIGPREAVFQKGSHGELQAVVPGSAVSGAVTVETPEGRAVSAGEVLVAVGPGPVGLTFEGLYLSQATQRLDGSVPLVANRDATARAFLIADQANALRPRVRVTLFTATGAIAFAAETQCAAGGVALALEEAAADRSWNIRIPGNIIQPGCRVRAEVLPTPGLELPPGGITWPAAGGASPLTVVPAPPMGITLIPVATPWGTGQVVEGSRTLASWGARFKATYPLDRLDIQLGETFFHGKPLNNLVGMWTLRDALERKRLLENPTSRRYAFGVFPRPLGSRILGLGATPTSPTSNLNRTAIGHGETGLQDGENYPEVLAHEFGHLLDRSHAPCGGAAGIDPVYPYSGARLGAFGLDTQSGQVFNPSLYYDLMSYCSPTWISGYTYKGVLAFRAGEPAALDGLAALAAERGTQPGLLVSGSLHNGVLTLEPCLATTGGWSEPDPGPFTLRLLGADGAVLREVSFSAPDTPDLPPGESYQSFAFVLPRPAALEAALARMEVRQGDRLLGSLETAAAAPAAGSGSALARALGPAPLNREPRAVRLGAGRVYLGWDAASHPQVVVRNPASGAVLAIGAGGSLEFACAARELELLLADGLRTVTRRVPVQEP